MNKATKEAFDAIDEAKHIESIRGMVFGESYRVSKKLAAKWLLENKTVVVNGTVHWLQIQNLGLGICAIALAPTPQRETKMTKLIC